MTENAGLTITRVFDAPQRVVYDAWTTPQHFAAWFGGAASDIDVESVILDARPGGQWKATMVVRDMDFTIDWVGEYLEVTAPTHLALTISDQPGPERETITVDLETVPAGTRMVMRQFGGHLTPEQYEQTQAGYSTFFDALDDLLARLQAAHPES